jgi:hypothetical protein
MGIFSDLAFLTVSVAALLARLAVLSTSTSFAPDESLI